MSIYTYVCVYVNVYTHEGLRTEKSLLLIYIGPVKIKVISYVSVHLLYVCT